MCGRYTITCDLEDLIAEFGIEFATDFAPRYNVAPTQSAPVVRVLDDRTRLDSLRWGLILSWSKDAGMGARMINARAETADSKPAFRSAFKLRRCIVPATGFYEWKKPTGEAKKQPYWIHRADGAPFAMAGLWERWQPEDGETVETFSILTTEPNDRMCALHDRMPALLGPDDYADWLDPSASDKTRIKSLLRPWTGAPLELTPVSTRVNSPRNDDASLIQRIGDADSDEDDRECQSSLF